MTQKGPIEAFADECEANIRKQGEDKDLHALSLQWNASSAAYKYTYNFTSLGRPVIQLPQDMVAVQELIWQIRPDLIIETGVAHGGSLVMSAASLALLEFCDARNSNKSLDPAAPSRHVIGIDIDIREHNRRAIETHPMSDRIILIEGSSTSSDVVDQVRKIAATKERILVFLDSNHTHEHVLDELRAYAPLVSPGSYCVVFDTVIEDLPEDFFPDRPWSRGNNPRTAVAAFLSENDDFVVDSLQDARLLISVAPGGWLRRRG